jgi:hypothetical protein
MTCPSCKKGVLSRTRKPDALGRTIEKCDHCSYRRVVDAPKAAEALSGSLAVQNGGNPQRVDTPRLIAPVAVVGEPCPCCHRKVSKLPLCVKCKRNRRILGKTKCEECSQPATLKPRYCVKCGEQFTPQRGEKLTGVAAYHCPTHRATKKARVKRKAAA